MIFNMKIHISVNIITTKHLKIGVKPTCKMYKPILQTVDNISAVCRSYNIAYLSTGLLYNFHNACYTEKSFDKER